MSYLASGNISIFPYGSTRTDQPYSRVLNEQNITALIRSITDNESYVISYNNDTKQIKFVIGGYFVEANISAFVPTETSVPFIPLYAAITLTSGTETDVYYLSGGDDQDSNFTGVNFVSSTNKPSGYTYVLKILDENRDVPSDSFKKFIKRSLPDTEALPDLFQCTLPNNNNS